MFPFLMASAALPVDIGAQLIAIAVAVISVAVVVSVYVGKRNQSLRDIQDKTISALEADLALKDSRNIELQTDNDTKQAQIEELTVEAHKVAADMATVRQMVTQAAKVEALRAESKAWAEVNQAAYTKVHETLELILRALPPQEKK